VSAKGATFGRQEDVSKESNTPNSQKAATPQNGAGASAALNQASPETNKSLESWIWDAACSIRGAKDAPKFKEFILPLIFAKRLCDVFDDELNRIAKEVGSRAKAFKLVKHDKKLVRFYLPLEPKNPDDTCKGTEQLRRLEGLGENHDSTRISPRR
jgi:type I restriction enzyme M protein